MKSKLLVALVLLASGSAFAQTRFSIGIGIGGHAPGYYAPVPAYVAKPGRITALTAIPTVTFPVIMAAAPATGVKVPKGSTSVPNGKACATTMQMSA